MDLEQVFGGLDSVRWTELEHAYGDATDLPDVLRAIAGDEDQAAEALDELWGSILHQGTVYGATVAAVPFLARIAAAGARTLELLVLLGGIAESDAAYDGQDAHTGYEGYRAHAEYDAYDAPRPGACRAAVAAELPLLLPLLESADDSVRLAAVWATGRTGTPVVLPALRRRWTLERDPGVRAGLLAALVRLDPRSTTPAVRAALAADEPAELRIVAVMASLDAGLPWSPEHRDTVLSLLPADPLVSGLDQDRTEPLHYIVDALLHRDTDTDRASAYELIEAALRLTGPDARKEALWAAEHACMISRGAPGRLAPALLALPADPAFTHMASLLPILDKLGAHAEPAAPMLAALAGADGDLADRALAVLVRVAPEQAAPLLARDLGNRSRALAAVTGTRGLRASLPVPYAPELLNAIRIRLTADDLGRDAAAELTRLLAQWGPRAAACLPELTAVLDRFPALVPPALAAVCPPEGRPATAALLRRAAESGEPRDRCAAAEALWSLSGETGPLVTALRDVLREDIDPQVPKTVAALGPDAAVLVPELRAALSPGGDTRTVPAMNTDIQTALALWRLTGDADEAVKVLGGVLAEAADGMWTRWPLTNAARAAAELGPAARELAPALEALLDDPVQAPTAIIALQSTGCALDAAQAADLLLTSAERDADAATALEALGTLGPEALTPDTTTRLTTLAERDLRVVTSGLEPEIVPADERLRERARRLLVPEPGA
ncbi:HEAT repeat domain-containing protein [Streptomyces sp. NPDC055078]